MMAFEDACVDATLYAQWLKELTSVQALAARAASIMGCVGLLLPGEFAICLDLLPADELAAFTAANYPFATDDETWRAHCLALYERPDHPSLTAEQRNGHRASWGGGK